MEKMSLQFEATNKVKNSDGGTSQQVYVQTGNDRIFDAMIDLVRTGASSQTFLKFAKNTVC